MDHGSSEPCTLLRTTTKTPQMTTRVMKGERRGDTLEEAARGRTKDVLQYPVASTSREDISLPPDSDWRMHGTTEMD